MMEQKISSLQLLYAIVGYVLGTAMILGSGAEVKQDSWVFILFGLFCGLILMGIYTQLSTYYPNHSLVQMIPKIIGRYLSYPIILLYILHFIYSAARACRELGDLIVSTILTETPVIVVIGSFMILLIYCLSGGVETFCRTGEIVFPVYVLALLVIWVLLFTVEGFDLNQLVPILGNGVTPVMKQVLPSVVNFPFGETIVFMMFFPFLNDKKSVRKIGLFGILFGGILLTSNSIMMLSVLGPEIYSQTYFPLLIATQMVTIADFLERFDVIVILLMVTGVFFKAGGFAFGAAIGITQLFKLKQSRSVILGVGTIIPPLSLISASSYVEHIEIGFTVFVPYIHTVLQIILPVLLLCIAIVRKKLGHS
ncbi:endospore germination permease [Mesobacillus maritimus]|uniref:GerAB/ArcD/ProY family transporter n=1 Tax=Mesobacillus maritimus TaxID=1643336 RepID=UPI00384A87C7